MVEIFRLSSEMIKHFSDKVNLAELSSTTQVL